MLNTDNATRAENLRLCKDLLKKGLTQREIAKSLGLSLPTVNKYCQRIAAEIEEAERKKEEARQKAEVAAETRSRRMKKIREETETAKIVAAMQTPEELAKQSFAACLLELKIRLPLMTNAEVITITTELWDRMSK